MNRLVLSACFVLGGCAQVSHFKLAESVTAPVGVTQAQNDENIKTCNDRAFVAGNNPPLPDGKNEAVQRAVYAECLKARGYTVVPVRN